jgi:hypothetical protein
MNVLLSITTRATEWLVGAARVVRYRNIYAAKRPNWPRRAPESRRAW